MGFWDNSLRIFQCLCAHGTQSVRPMAHQTGFSKRSVPRLQQAMERRARHPESWGWDTEAGRHGLTRLVVATLSPCGLKRGVGLDTRSAFLARLRLETQVGWSPAAFRGVRQTLEATRVETAAAWEQDGIAAGEGREMMGAVDATFLAPMRLVWQDVLTGYRGQAEGSDARPYATWQAGVDERLQARSTSVLSWVRDRAKALMQRADKGLEGLRLPDCFHVVPDLVQSDALAIGRRVRQAHTHLEPAEAVLASPPGMAQGPETQAEGEAGRGAALGSGEHPSRHHRETLALTLPLFGIADAAPPSAAPVDSRFHAAVEAIAALARRHHCPAHHDARHTVRQQ
jgi:hypothetical protein